MPPGISSALAVSCHPPGTHMGWDVTLLFAPGGQLLSHGLCGLSVGESGPRAGLGPALPPWSAAVPVCHVRLVTSLLL